MSNTIHQTDGNGKREQKSNIEATGRKQLLGDSDHQTEGNGTVSTLKRFVTFYITHFPPQALTFFLRRGFEVCGILEDVFVVNNRNRNGELYGFVQFAKVRNVNKLLKALNNVCFGQYCVCVVPARFDRKGERKGIEATEDEGVGGKTGLIGGEVVKMRKKEAKGEKRKDGLKGRIDDGKKKDDGTMEGRCR